MSQRIGVINYGYSGNVYNIEKAVSFLNQEVKLITINTGSDLRLVDKIILPGVGVYRDAMEKLSLVKDALKEQIQVKPTLGICLGMQILSEKGYEFGETEGMGLIEGEVMRMPVKCRVPHIGWSGIEKIKESVILKGVNQADNFYFMHSFELMNYKDVVGLSLYCEHRYVSVIERGNVFGVQFHPEKSRLSGLKIFKNFLAL